MPAPGLGSQPPPPAPPTRAQLCPFAPTRDAPGPAGTIGPPGVRLDVEQGLVGGGQKSGCHGTLLRPCSAAAFSSQSRPSAWPFLLKGKPSPRPADETGLLASSDSRGLLTGSGRSTAGAGWLPSARRLTLMPFRTLKRRELSGSSVFSASSLSLYWNPGVMCRPESSSLGGRTAWRPLGVARDLRFGREVGRAERSAC